MKLSDLQCGEIAVIKKIYCNEKMAKRLFVMGLVEGIKVKIIKISPFGSPIELKVRDCYLALRRKTAEDIEVNNE